MAIKQLLILLTIILGHQCVFLDSTVIIINNKTIPDQFIQTCNNQLSSSYFQDQENSFQQIVNGVKEHFKTDPTHFILKIIFWTQGDKKPFQNLKSSVVGQFTSYLFGLKVGILIFGCVLIYWVYSALNKALIPRLTKQSSFKLQKLYFDATIAIFIILSSLGAIFIAYGFFHTNVQKLASTFLCTVGSLNVQQPFKDAETFTKTYAKLYSPMKQLMLEENRLNFVQIVDYSKKLLKAVQSSSHNKDENFVNELKEAVEHLNKTLPYYLSFRKDNLDFNDTIQLMRQRLARVIIYKHISIEYLSKYISIQSLPSKINIICNIFYLFILASFIYITTQGLQLILKNKRILFKNSHLIPYLLTIIIIVSLTIVIITSIFTPALVLASNSFQTIRGNNLTQPPNVNICKLDFPEYADKVVEFIKILFNRDYNVQNIYNGSIYRSGVNYNKYTAVLQEKDDDYLFKLFKEAESKVDPGKLQEAIYNIKFFQRLLFQKEYAKWLMINLKQSSKVTNQILKSQLLTNPKISTKKSKEYHFNKTFLVQKSLIIQSQKAHILFKKIGVIAFFSLICQMILQKALLNRKRISNNQVQVNTGTADEDSPLSVHKQSVEQTPSREKGPL